jgi:hypothetical protein
MQRFSLGLITTFALLNSTPLLAQDDSDMEGSSGASHNLEFANRTRYAEVSDGNTDNDRGKDFSALFRINLKSRWTEQLNTTLEVDYVHSFWPGEHFNGVDASTKPIIADAPGGDLNQAFLAYDFSDALVKLGRQRLAFDNKRFIGGNELWQNEQTFDALHGVLKLQSNSAVSYSYVANVNRIFGDQADRGNSIYDASYNGHNSWDEIPPKIQRPDGLLGDHEHNTHLLHLEWNEWDYSQLVGYAYRLRNKNFTSDSSDTIGASYSFNFKDDLLKYRLQAEAATQKRSEIIDAPRVPYYLLDAGAGFNTLELSGRYEVMGADKNIPFITPLGSLYDFMGWANKFGTTPETGVKDSSLRLLWRSSPFRVDIRYHIFHAYDGGTRLGDEADLDVMYKPNRKHALSLRFAYFEPEESGQPHTRRLYLDYTYNL